MTVAFRFSGQSGVYGFLVLKPCTGFVTGRVKALPESPADAFFRTTIFQGYSWQTIYKADMQNA